MAKKVQAEGVYFFITEEGKPRYFVRLTLRFQQDEKGWYGLCAQPATGTSYCETAEEAREQLLGMVKLYMDGTADRTSLADWLTAQGATVYPIPDCIQLENSETAALAEPMPGPALTSVPA